MYKDNDFNGGNRIPSIILVCKKTKKKPYFSFGPQCKTTKLFFCFHRED